MRRTLVFAALALLPACLPAELFHVRTLPLAPGFTFLRGGGGNSVVLVRGERALVFDAKMWPFGEEVARVVAAAGATPEFLVDSHLHFDHTGANDLELAQGAILVAAESTLAFLASDRVGRIAPVFGGAPWLPVHRRVTLEVEGEPVEVVHPAAAHTDGDVYAWFPDERTLATGDLYTAGFYPHVDPLHGGTMLGLLAALDELCRYPATRVLPGHGPAASRADLVAYRDFLRSLRDEVLRRRGRGESDEAIVRAMIAPRGEPYRNLGGFSSRADVVRRLVDETRVSARGSASAR